VHGGARRGCAARLECGELLLPRLPALPFAITKLGVIRKLGAVAEAAHFPIIPTSAYRARKRQSRTRSAHREFKDNNVQQSRPPEKPRVNKAWYWLLVIPYLAILWLPSYNRIERARLACRSLLVSIAVGGVIDARD